MSVTEMKWKLSTAEKVVVERATVNHCSKLVVLSDNDSELGSFECSKDMTTEQFKTEYGILIRTVGDREITQMSVLRTAKRGQHIDNGPCTLSIRVR